MIIFLYCYGNHNWQNHWKNFLNWNFRLCPAIFQVCSKGLLIEEEMGAKTTPARAVSLPTRFSLTEPEQSKQGKILTTGSINKAKWWTRFRAHPGSPARRKKDRVRDRGQETRLQDRSKVCLGDIPETELEVDTPRHSSGSDQGLT